MLERQSYYETFVEASLVRMGVFELCCINNLLLIQINFLMAFCLMINNKHSILSLRNFAFKSLLVL